MKDNGWKGIITLVIVTVIAFGVILGANYFGRGTDKETEQSVAGEQKEIDINSFGNVDPAIQSAYRILDEQGNAGGYKVVTKTKGYGGDLLLELVFDKNGDTITRMEVLEHNETEGLGALIKEPAFLEQFKNVPLPVTLKNAAAEPELPAEGAAFEDGTYTVEADQPDYNGYRNTMKLTITDGKMTEIIWDALDTEGKSKRVLSDNGEYVMTESGPTWKEQAEALAAAVIENQSTDFLSPDDQGKTDAVAGVSISITDFVTLVKQCLVQAAGTQTEDSRTADAAGSADLTGSADAAGSADSGRGTTVDGVSGATISSRAVIEGIDKGYTFIKNYLGTLS